MGELTTCNYCNLQMIKQKAKIEGAKVILKKSSFMGGTDVYYVPKGEELNDKTDERGNPVPGSHWRCWLHTITDSCCC